MVVAGKSPKVAPCTEPHLIPPGMLDRPGWFSRLGRAFAAARSFGEAFGIYENARKERANGVQLASREQVNEIQGDGKGTKSWSNR
jgi:hypothetical protein